MAAPTTKTIADLNGKWTMVSFPRNPPPHVMAIPANNITTSPSMPKGK